MAHEQEAMGDLNVSFSVNNALRDEMLYKLRDYVEAVGYSVNVYTNEQDNSKRDGIPAGNLSNVSKVHVSSEYARASHEKDLSSNSNLSLDQYDFYVHDTPGTWFDGANALKVAFTLESTVGDQLIRFITAYLNDVGNTVLGHGLMPAGRTLVQDTPQNYYLYIKV